MLCRRSQISSARSLTHTNTVALYGDQHKLGTDFCPFHTRFVTIIYFHNTEHTEQTLSTGPRKWSRIHSV